MKKIIWAIAFTGALFLASCGSKDAASTAPETLSETTAVDTQPMDDMAGMDHSQMDGMAAQASDDISLVNPSAEAMPMGDAELVVAIAKDGLTADEVQVEVSMPMAGEEPMTSMAVVEPGEAANQFNIKTNFGMAGPWSVHVMAKDAEPATFVFNVQ